MKSAVPETEPQFTKPVRSIATMLIVTVLVGIGAWAAIPIIGPIFFANIYLNGLIVTVFILGVLSCFWQVFSLVSSINWIEGFAAQRAGAKFVPPPRLLVSLSTLLKSRGEKMQINAASSQSILDSMATRLDEGREITRYITSLLIFLGLLGTFYGLATTVPAVVETIRSLAPSSGENSVDIFGRLMTGLEKQLGGMGTAFSSSLLGLAGSLVVGLLDLFTGQSQNRYYREIEEWISTITRVGFSTGEGEISAASGDTDAVLYLMVDSVEALHQTLVRSEATQTDSAETIAQLTQAMTELSHQFSNQQDSTAKTAATAATEVQNRLLAQIAEGQSKLATIMGAQTDDVKRQADLLQKQTDEPTDAESRMRLRSIDIVLLKILEEMSAGRQDTVAELRGDMAALNKAIRSLNRKPPVQPQAPAGRGKG